MKIPDLSIIEKTLNNEATSEESCEVVRWFKTPEGQAWLAERIDQDEKTIHMGEEEAWIDHPIPSAVMYQNIMRQLRRQKIRRFIAYAAAVFIPIAFNYRTFHTHKLTSGFCWRMMAMTRCTYLMGNACKCFFKMGVRSI